LQILRHSGPSPTAASTESGFICKWCDAYRLLLGIPPKLTYLSIYLPTYLSIHLIKRNLTSVI
jgi:hypothetical protein